MWRHSWSVIRFRPARVPGLLDARGDLARHDRAVDDLARRAAGPGAPRRRRGPTRRLSAIGGRRCVPASLLERRTSTRRGDLVAVEDVVPLEAVDLGAAQAGVEGDRVGETVLGLERGEQRRGLGRQRDAQARLLVVGRQLDQAQRVAGDEPARRRGRPGVDARRDRDVLGDGRASQARAGELVDPPLPVDLGDLLGDPRAELRQQVVLQRAAHRADRRVRVRLAAGRGAGRCGPARRRRATARRASSNVGPTRGQLGEVVSALAHRREPAQDLGAALASPSARSGLPVDRVPARGRARRACSGSAPPASS